MEELGHRVLVGNPRKLRVIWESDNKQDTRDAEILARIARFDPSLLYPIHHRGERAQSHLSMIRARDALVRARRVLVGSARGLVKAQGARIGTCAAEYFHRRLLAEMPEELQGPLDPMARRATAACPSKPWRSRVSCRASTSKRPKGSAFAEATA